MIEINIETMALDADIPPQEALDSGVQPRVHVQVVGGNELPFADPRNPDRPMRQPALAINYELTRSAALQFAELIKSKAESLPDDSASSKIVTAKDISEAGKVVDFQKALRGRKDK